MNPIRAFQNISYRRLGAAVLIVMLGSFAAARGQEEKKAEHKEKRGEQRAPRQAEPRGEQRKAENPRQQPAARAPERVETPRQQAPARIETPRQQAPARVETPRQQAPARIYTPRAQEPGRVQAPPQQAPSQQAPARVHGNFPVAPNAPARVNRPAEPARNQVVRFPNGQPHTVRMRDGAAVRRSQTGRVMEVHTPTGAVIRHSPTGVRRVEVPQSGGRVVVAAGPRHGYVQRPVVFGGHGFVQRTYVRRNATYVRVYRPAVFHGVALDIYTPVHYYRPAYYGWAYRPWPRQFSYGWGWRNDPWYSYYGWYFTPYPSYASPALWLTDYMIAAILQEAYDERVASGAVPPPAAYPVTQAELTPEVKQLIADEVRRDIEAEQAASENVDAAAYGTSDVPPMFADNARHVLVVSNALLVTSGADQCELSEGDVIETAGAPPPNSPAADAVVLASKPQECRKGTRVSVAIEDLQDMQNRMQATIDQGLGDLQTSGGQAGLPAPPPDTGGTVDAPFAGQVEPDSNVAAQLAQAEAAGSTEQSVVDESAQVASGGAPASIVLNQTIAEVVAIQGQPQKIVDLGEKKIYVYPDLKITFQNGKVADVE